MAYNSGIVPPELDIFYVLDTSSSMKGQSITTLNRAMVNTIDELREEAKHNRNARIRVAVLEFNTDCRWVTKNGPEYLEHFKWDYLEPYGLTSVGKALDALNQKLTTVDHGGFIDVSSGALVPAFIFMTDGYATDEYQKSLDAIKQNKWFSRATRVGFAIGKKPDEEMIARLTGSSEAVIRTEDLNLFTALLKWVSVTTSMVASQPNVSGRTNRGAEAVDKAKKQMQGEGDWFDPDAVSPGVSYEEKPVTGGSWGQSVNDAFGGDWDIDGDWDTGGYN